MILSLTTISAWGALCLMLLLVPGCHVQSRTEAGSGPKPLQLPSQTTKSHDLINSGIFDHNPTALKAWLSFIEDGKFRAAQGEDFKFSEPAKRELRSMFGDQWYPRINHPAITGNINRRHEFHDLAVIVVHTARNDPARFGLVIFNVEPNKEQTTSVHWLFQIRDLSTSLLSWHSNWPVLVFYAEDGSADPHYINWDDNAKRYFLDKRQVGPGARAGRLREKGEH